MARPARFGLLLSLPLVLLVAGSASLSQAAPGAAAPGALPPLPGGGAPTAGVPPAATSTEGGGGFAGASTEAIRRGVVQIEQGGRPIAIGAVLGKDGRVLTSLSGLGAVAEPEIRYADGSVVKARIVHRDKVWDLALLVPSSGRWLDGLVPSDGDPATLAEIKAFLPARSGKLAPMVVAYKGRADARSKDGDLLRATMEVDLKGAPSVPGAPLLDAGGEVLGVLVKACKEPPPPPDAKGDPRPAACTPVLVGAPVYALRGFLMKAPASAVMPAPWLGLGGAPSAAGNVRGVRVVGVAPGSPAEKAGLKAGDGADTIVAVDGQPVESPEQLAEVIGKRAIGQTVKLLVYSGGKFREVPVSLRAAP